MRSRRCVAPPLVLLAAGAALVAYSHPMGNFSVSHYSRFEVAPDSGQVKIYYVLDLAELPSFELLQKWGLRQDATREQVRQHAVDEMRDWTSKGLRFRSNGMPVRARVVDVEATAGQGAGAMPVFRIAANLVIDGLRPGVLEFEDANYPDRAGWKEIVLAGVQDRSKSLTAYPAAEDPTAPQDLRARLEWGTGAGAGATLTLEKGPQRAASSGSSVAAVAVPKVTKGKDSLSALVSQKDLSPAALLVALALAFGFGCAHAMTPGHGKTMVAAYLVGERGTAWHAVLLGLTTTFVHTVSVFLLGIAMYFLAGSFAPEKVTRILEFISGLAIAILGLWLLYQRVLRLQGGHSHGHHHHHHHGHSHSHDHGHGGEEGHVTVGSLIALGASGGLVPCPSALVLLLSSIALGRVGLGLVLLVAFSMGLASVLVAIGMAVLFAKNLMPAGVTSPENRFFRWVPVLSAGVIVAIGVVLTGVSLGLVKSAI